MFQISSHEHRSATTDYHAVRPTNQHQPADRFVVEWQALVLSHTHTYMRYRHVVNLDNNHKPVCLPRRLSIRNYRRTCIADPDRLAACFWTEVDNCQNINLQQLQLHKP